MDYEDGNVFLVGTRRDTLSGVWDTLACSCQNFATRHYCHHITDALVDVSLEHLRGSGQGFYEIWLFASDPLLVLGRVILTHEGDHVHVTIPNFTKLKTADSYVTKSKTAVSFVLPASASLFSVRRDFVEFLQSKLDDETFPCKHCGNGSKVRQDDLNERDSCIDYYMRFAFELCFRCSVDGAIIQDNLGTPL